MRDVKKQTLYIVLDITLCRLSWSESESAVECPECLANLSQWSALSSQSPSPGLVHTAQAHLRSRRGLCVTIRLLSVCSTRLQTLTSHCLCVGNVHAGRLPVVCVDVGIEGIGFIVDLGYLARRISPAHHWHGLRLTTASRTVHLTPRIS